jgi:hypothetical protein
MLLCLVLALHHPSLLEPKSQAPEAPPTPTLVQTLRLPLCLHHLYCSALKLITLPGTITLLVVKGDERVGRFRDRSSSLRAYASLNDLPASLTDSMQDHLRLHFNSEEASDEQVLPG